MNIKRFRYIILPQILWYITGRCLFDIAYSYWWLNIAKREPLWSDADPEQCVHKCCRYCGKGTITN